MVLFCADVHSCISERVDVFFAKQPHASFLLHRSTFLANLAQPPSHPRFPTTALLHAICAVGSQYVDDWSAHLVFAEIPSFNPAIFAEKHISLAQQQAKNMVKSDQELLQALQAYILISWYHSCHSASEVTKSRKRYETPLLTCFSVVFGLRRYNTPLRLHGTQHLSTFHVSSNH